MFNRDQMEEIQIQLYKAVQRNDRTGQGLINEGFVRSHVQYCMPRLVEKGLIFKHGYGKKQYYSVNAKENIATTSRKLDPIKIPEGYANNFALAFRMGFTDIVPVKGRVHKGIMA